MTSRPTDSGGGAVLARRLPGLADVDVEGGVPETTVATGGGALAFLRLGSLICPAEGGWVLADSGSCGFSGAGLIASHSSLKAHKTDSNVRLLKCKQFLMQATP